MQEMVFSGSFSIAERRENKRKKRKKTERGWERRRKKRKKLKKTEKNLEKYGVIYSHFLKYML